MNLILANFQIKAIRELTEAMHSDKREIILKSCTGSGKTIILTHFMSNYIKSFEKTVFVWLTPGKGNLEEQSKAKMDKYIHGSHTKLLCDVMTGGFEENDCCFINWEKLTKKGNNALKEGERENFIEYIEDALQKGLSFKIIVDESHHNNTIKAKEIIEYFKTDKIIRCSATPKEYKNEYLIDVPEREVIEEGLIKKMIIINQEMEQDTVIKSRVEFLLDKATKKHKELKKGYKENNSKVNPLIIVQIPNNSTGLLEDVESYFYSKDITYENNMLAVWLSDKKQNIENIEAGDNPAIAIIIKQAVATGWDCPRAQILVKFRDNMNEVFEIQTIGRIRRMPEAKHYENDLLDCCYLYTLDEKFANNVKLNMGKYALESEMLYLKPERKNFALVSQYKTSVPFPRDGKLALRVIYSYFLNKYKLNENLSDNKKVLKTYGYNCDEDIVFKTKTGSMAVTDKNKDLDTVNIKYRCNTKKYGREYHYAVSNIGLKANLDYNQVNAIMRKMFLKKIKSKYSVLQLEDAGFYSFVINNKHKLTEVIREALADENAQISFKYNAVTERPFHFPEECCFTYDKMEKSNCIMKKNVYQGYLSSAQIRSASEKLFEKHCEKSNNVEWFYKNGDKGQEYLSIVYEDNNNHQKSFYPDYVVGTIEGQVWIIETKGGFSRYGDSEDIDLYTPKKFKVLKAYTDKFNLKGGIVRQDKQSTELCICTEKYSENLKSNSWKLLEDLL